MAAWYKRKLQEDAALDATMAEVVEYDYFQSIKPPRAVDAYDTAASTSPPVPETTATQSPRPFASDPALSLAAWQTERSELRLLERCANQSAVYIGACTLTAAVATFVVARQRYQRSRIGALFSSVGVALVTASATWRVWGRGCAVDFLQSDGRVADKARRRLREEMSDHPILIGYEDMQRAKRASSGGSGQTGVAQPIAKDAR